MTAHDSYPLTTGLLKAGLHRRVFLEEDASGAIRIVKRFESRSLLRRARDRGRAEREFRILEALHAAGVPVPCPHELRKREGAWEFTCKFIEGARALDTLLEGRSELAEGVPASVHASNLGRTLAAAHAAGLDHGDLHAGNWLLDAHGGAWLIDFGHAKLRDVLGSEELVRDLVQLTAATRERTSLRARQRALIAWYRALSVENREDLPPLGELASRVEREAIERRVRVVHEHSDRWLRESGRCRRLDSMTLVARELGDEEVQQVMDWLRTTPVTGAAAAHPSDSNRELHIIEGTDTLRVDWTELARAYEHALPAMRPLLLSEAGSALAVLSAPRGSRPCSPTDSTLAPPLAELNEHLRFRGLRELADTAALWFTPTGELLLGPESRLLPADRSGGSLDG